MCNVARELVAVVRWWLAEKRALALMLTHCHCTFSWMKRQATAGKKCTQSRALYRNFRTLPKHMLAHRWVCVELSWIAFGVQGCRCFFSSLLFLLVTWLVFFPVFLPSFKRLLICCCYHALFPKRNAWHSVFGFVSFGLVSVFFVCRKLSSARQAYRGDKYALNENTCILFALCTIWRAWTTANANLPPFRAIAHSWRPPSTSNKLRGRRKSEARETKLNSIKTTPDNAGGPNTHIACSAMIQTNFCDLIFVFVAHSYAGHTKVSEVLYMGNKFRKLNRDLTGHGLF